jgi:hypothetical protein
LDLTAVECKRIMVLLQVTKHSLLLKLLQLVQGSKTLLLRVLLILNLLLFNNQKFNNLKKWLLTMVKKRNEQSLIRKSSSL